MKRTLQPSEHAIQAAFIDWVHSVENMPGYEPLRLSFAVPNGARVRWGTANKLKSEGMRKGVPDWIFPVGVYVADANGRFSWNGLAIEFKANRGVVSAEQQDYMDRLKASGWQVHICRSTEEAIAVVKAYLGVR